MFDIRWTKTGPVIRGNRKTTICRIYLMSNGQEILIAEGAAHWNYEHDEYDLQIGQWESLKRAAAQVPNILQGEFTEWVAELQ